MLGHVLPGKRDLRACAGSLQRHAGKIVAEKVAMLPRVDGTNVRKGQRRYQRRLPSILDSDIDHRHPAARINERARGVNGTGP